MESLRLKFSNHMDSTYSIHDDSMILHDLAWYCMILHVISRVQLMTLHERMERRKACWHFNEFVPTSWCTFDYFNLDSKMSRRWTGRKLQSKRFLLPARVQCAVRHAMLNICKACELPRLARLNEVALPLTKGEARGKTSPVKSQHQLAEFKSLLNLIPDAFLVFSRQFSQQKHVFIQRKMAKPTQQLPKRNYMTLQL